MRRSEKTLAILTEQVVAFRNARDWQQFHSPSQMLLALFCEVSELATQFQWLDEKESKQYAKKMKNAVGDELADVLYWTVLIANDLGVPLDQAFSNKLKKNAKKYPVRLARGKKTKYTELKK